MATRYKLTKDQLERIVENFVMESASIESKKAPVKNHIPSQGAEAKKHVKNKITGDIVEPSEGVPAKPPVMKKKLSQAADAKKHVSNTKMKHTNKAKVVKEEKQELIKEFLGELSDVDVMSVQAMVGIVGTIGAGLYLLWKKMGNDDSNMSKDQKIKKAEQLKSKADAGEINQKTINKAEELGNELKKNKNDESKSIKNMGKDMGSKNF